MMSVLVTQIVSLYERGSIILTNKFAFPQQLQMSPEDVALVMRNKLDEVVVFELAQLLSSEVEAVNVDALE